MRLNRPWWTSYKFIFAFLGLLIGISIFVASLIAHAWALTSSISIVSLWEVWKGEPLLWMVFLLSFILLYVGSIFGRRLDKRIKGILPEEFNRDKTINEILEEINILRTEVTENQDLQRIISQAKKEWEATFDAVAEIILITDMDNIIIRCNKACIDTLNFNNGAGKTQTRLVRIELK